MQLEQPQKNFDYHEYLEYKTMELPIVPGIILTGTGSAVPTTYLDNRQLSQVVVTSDE
ncbi:MAG: hypothetical protein JOZ78_26065 [Chroococcidiopsidaceae cyanobacterium CP_BM_ER_R8_30]|nr:hypothetical protein [Chroococcidiopsidaceae cyanobacterium CP_BM_ER_R8_30]